MTTAAAKFLREGGTLHGVRDDWDVRIEPTGIEVSAWTADRFTRPEQATLVLVRILHELTSLGLRVGETCELGAHRDSDGDWRGHLTVLLQPEPAALLTVG